MRQFTKIFSVVLVGVLLLCGCGASLKQGSSNESQEKNMEWRIVSSANYAAGDILLSQSQFTYDTNGIFMSGQRKAARLNHDGMATYYNANSIEGYDISEISKEDYEAYYQDLSDPTNTIIKKPTETDKSDYNNVQWEYDEQGNITKTIVPKEDNLGYGATYIYEYDTHDNLIYSETITDGEYSSLHFINEYQYDRSGRLVQRKHFEENHAVATEGLYPEKYTEIHKYEYDQAGHLVKDITFKEDGKTLLGYAEYTYAQYEVDPSYKEIETTTDEPQQEGVDWEISDDCTTLTVSGKGSWHPSKEETEEIAKFGQTITTMIVEEGITDIDLIPPDDESTWEPRGLYQLTDVSLPSTLKSITGVFYGAKSLTNITLPESVGFISSFAFAKSGLKEITLPENVKDIGAFAFWQCNNLEKVNILGAVDIEEEAFSYSERLSTVNAACIRTIGKQAFQDCPLKYIELSEGLTSIGDEAFQYCDLEEIDLPDGLETVGKEVFNLCPLRKISFPESVKSVDRDWNFGCDHLEEVVFRGTLKEWISLGLDKEIVVDSFANKTVTVTCMQ